MAPKRAPKSGDAQPNKFKQGNLFSFFAKKPTAGAAKPAAAAAPAPPPAAPLPAKAPPAPPAKAAAACPVLAIGTAVEVYWPDDEAYYHATIVKTRKDGHYYLEYDDGQCEWIDLAGEQYRLAKKRRRLAEDDDDDEGECEFDNAASESEGSAYKDDGAAVDVAEDDDDDDQWMVTDDEDDQEVVAKKKKKLTKKVTHHTVSSSSSSSGKTPARPTMTAPDLSSFSASSSSALRRATPKHVTPALAVSSKTTPTMNQPSQYTPSSTTTPSATPKALPYNKGEVNPAGSHVHNHLRFLQQPRDANGRTLDDANYDCRTLKIVHADWETHCGKMTDAVKQWWDLKAQYFDTVLLFKTGKFYEMFHMDADVGVEVLGLLYMKGHVAHAGFPEISYGPMADKLVRAGYKVARVEQTETPAQLKERKKTHKGGRAPKVVNREVCSVLSLGTRTFCYLDDEQGLMEKEGTGVGPLLAICEVLVDSMDEEGGEEDAVRPVCEYGITVVDAVRGSVTIGQFADDVLRSRMNTLLAAYGPSEILVQGGENGASRDLLSLIRSLQSTAAFNFRVETIREEESFPKSTAIDASDRRQIERPTSMVHPWLVEETLQEVHRRRYYPSASKKQDQMSASRWPKVLRAAVEGNAELALSSFGAALYYLQRNLIDGEILSMGVVKAYVPPASSVAPDQSSSPIGRLAQDEAREEAAVEEADGADPMECAQVYSSGEDNITHMALDGTTLENLEILANSVDHKATGSLWSLINHTKTPHGSRLLRAWLLRPLFRKADIDRRADAVQELVSGAAAVALSESSSVLAKCGDIERLLSRVHSMSGTATGDDESPSTGAHPNERAVLYEMGSYTKRKVGDFSKVLNGLRSVTSIPEIFAGLEIQSGLLHKIVRPTTEGGCFPDMVEELDWFFDNFDCDLAAKGMFEPSKGIDADYDAASEAIERIEGELNVYREEMCATELSPRALAKSSWKYINTKPDSKDKYLIELPANVAVPDDFIMKGKRGKGPKQVNKYQSSVVSQLVQQLEHAIDVQKERKARGMQLIFAKFDTKRALWAAAATATALLDALGSLAKASSNAGYTRPTILDCPPSTPSSIRVVQGRHPCVERTLGSGEFVPNDLALGLEREDGTAPRILLLSGVNMGGKSTCLRQTCLLSILAQIGCFVPADECALTPVDRIYTRLGASDRILMGQSTFFVELAETAAALRGATRRSLVIMDELGRGTSTFDGTAIASAAVKHLVERSKCISLFATHYHSLLDEWKDNPNVFLGHMECVVDNGNVTTRSDDENESTITFLYTLGEGGCPKSFGINVARLAGLPPDVLSNAKRISSDFERQMQQSGRPANAVTARSAPRQKQQILEAINSANWDELTRLWNELRP